MSDKAELDTFLKELLINGRVCPVPKKWNDFFSLITRKTDAQDLSAPLILGAWWATSNLDKKVRFKSHIEFAHSNLEFDKAKLFLNNLEESEWHHLHD